MREYKHLVWHCTATHEGKPITREILEEWHLAPKKVKGGWEYMGKVYPDKASLPNHTINGKSIKIITGRGWTKVGYAAMFHLGGTVEILNPYNNDSWIDAGEITNGVAGMNSTSRHFVYVGGLGKDGKSKDTRTEAQLLAMEIFTLDQIALNPDIVISGHNQHANKACPSFDVPKWLRSIGVEEKNIYLGRI